MEQAVLLLGVDARAGVMHFEAEAAAILLQSHGQADVPTLGELDCVAQKIQQDLPHAHLVAADADRPRRIASTLELQVALLRHRLHQRLHLVEQAGQIERAQVQLQPAGLDAGQIQRVVDQPQQVAASLLDRACIAALHRIQRGGQQQFAHAEHAGHRRAHLMAQRGQEPALGL